MTNPNNPYLGQRHVWVICTGQDAGTCSNYIPGDPDVPNVANWGGATASFGEVDQYRVYGKRISPLLIERTLDPNWTDDPNDPNDAPGVVERTINTYTVRVEVDTDQRELIHPAIEIYDGVPTDGAQSVAGIIDGTYYVYPVVFQDARFCYLPACSSSLDPPMAERCVWQESGFPLEPYYPDCPTGPIYPMDAITRVEPSADSSKVIRYTATWEYYNLETDPGQSNLLTSTINLDMTVYAPSVDWGGLMQSLMEYTYFYNGIYH